MTLAVLAGGCDGGEDTGQTSPRAENAAQRPKPVETVEYSALRSIDYADSSNLDIRQSDALPLRRRFGTHESFGGITHLYAQSDVLIVSDELMDPHLAVVRLRDGQIVDRFGSDGQGPDEVQNVTSLFQSRSAEETVGAFDVGNQRLNILQLSSSDHRLTLQRDVPFRSESMVISVYPLSDNRFIGGGGFSARYRLGIYDSIGRTRGHIQTSVPEIITPSMRKAYLDRSVLRAQLAKRPNRDQYALAFLELNRLEIIDVADQSFRVLKGPRPTEPKFTTEGPRPITIDWEEHERAHFSIAATSDRIYAAFCGCTHTPAAERTRDLSLPRRVHVYNWTGELIGELILDREVREIAVAPGDTLLYGAFQTPIPYVGEWELPAWVSNR